MTQPDPAASEPVGSVAEEAFKLIRAMASQQTTEADGSPHACSNAWCPVCQAVGFVRDNPDAIAHVAQSAATLTRSLRDLVESALTPREETT